MRSRLLRPWLGRIILPVVAAAVVLPACRVDAQSFDFDRLDKLVRSFSVIIDLKVELSFGTHTNEQEQRLLATVVREDGLLIFDGSFLSQDNVFSSMSGMQVKITPTRIEAHTFDDRTYEAEYLGTDRFTRIAFARVLDAEGAEFTPVRFAVNRQFEVGSWLALFMLLPEFVHPPLAADIGMVSSLVETPEKFALTVGFSGLEMSSVLFDERLTPVGVLGSLMDPTAAQADAGGLIESFGEFDIPLLGVITGERLAKMIADPPQRGRVDRAWLGITLQALTPDIAEFLGIETPGGIIVNDVMSGSPAEVADLRIGDVIYEVNGEAVQVDRDERLPIFQRRIAQMEAGSAVEFSVFRPSEMATDTLKLLTWLDKAPLAPSDAPEYESESLEFKVRDLVFADFVRYNQDESSFRGVVVSEMQRGGLAMLGGLQIADVVQRIGNTPVTSVEDVREAVKLIEASRPVEVIFFIWRDNKTMFVNVKTDWK
ncbi:MAG TPA: PDZ domain-containing protein [Acidobacteriota bacterium]|nr:PDZ domain-containing protein [Acidobacteriota bacterium]